ncbi:MAG: MoaD/ThiS family protein [Candidatus Didemnitutus sp.]|nr:MoaD/ThiS family protein [Candidatus Didemnitutus sp.]
MTPSRKITVKFFARLREQAGCRQLILETSAPTPATLYAELTRTHGLRIPPAILTFAVNGRYVPADTVLVVGDCVVFIPPVAGG